MSLDHPPRILNLELTIGLILTNGIIENVANGIWCLPLFLAPGYLATKTM